MKTNSKLKLAALYLTILCTAILSCKKEKKATTAFSQDILNIVSQKTIDSLRQFGMIIHEGTNPPNLVGTYYENQKYCTFDNSNSNKLGLRFLDYAYTFYNQNNSKLTVSLDYHTLDATTTETATGLGSYLSGNGKDFTAFLNITGIESGISNKKLVIISGTVGDDGIIGWQDCLKLVSKAADPKPYLIAVGGTRIFKEKDNLAAKTYVKVASTDKGQVILKATAGVD